MEPLVFGLLVGIAIGYIATLILVVDEQRRRFEKRIDRLTRRVEAPAVRRLSEPERYLLSRPGYTLKDGKVMYSAADLDRQADARYDLQAIRDDSGLRLVDEVTV